MKRHGAASSSQEHAEAVIASVSSSRLRGYQDCVGIKIELVSRTAWVSRIASISGLGQCQHRCAYRTPILVEPRVQDQRFVSVGIRTHF